MAIEYYDSLNVESNDDSYFLGNLGIGTTSPGAKLQIGSATYAPNANLGNNLLQIKSPSGYAYLTIGNGDSANATSYIGGASGFTVIGSVTDAGALSEHVRITNTGNVGIGTTSPTEDLSVSGDANITGKFAVGISATHPSIDFYNEGTAYFNGATTVDDTLDLVNLKVSGAQGTDGQVLTSTGSGVAWEDVSGGSSPWTTDTNGITYTAGNVGIGMASVAGIDLAVDGFVRLYDGFRVNGNTQMDGELSVLNSTSLSGELSLNGNDILTEGGDILDNTDSAGAINSFLMSKGTGNGVRWIPVNAASFNAVTSVTTGEPSGSDSVINIVSLTQAEYDAGTPVATTLYIIT